MRLSTHRRVCPKPGGFHSMSPEDDLAHRIVEDHYPGSTVCRLDCAGLFMEGGSIGCVTWNVLAREAGE